MNNFNINALAFAVGVAFSIGATAQDLSMNDYKVGKDKISADYQTAKASCSPLSGNANDICETEAKGRKKVAMADLETSYKPTVKNQYEARVVRAEADYALAKERCDDRAGNAKDICVKEAKAAETSAKADAKAQMKTSDANMTANEKSADARSEANSKADEARRDAVTDKLAAQHTVAKEKCDTYAGAAKDTCLDRAKARFAP